MSKRNCINFGKWNNKLLIPIIFPVFAFVRRYIRKYYIEPSSIKITNFYELFFNYISMSTCGIIYIFVYCNSKSEIVRESLKNNEIMIKNNTINSRITLNQYELEILEAKKNKKRKIKKNIYFSISFLLLSVGYIIQSVSKLEQAKIEDQFRQNIAVLFIILYLCLFSKIILKSTMTYHQIISIIVIGVCLIVFFIQTIIYKQQLTKDIIIQNIIYFLSIQLFFISGDVLGKRYLDNYEVSPYWFLFKIGFFGLLIIIIYDFIYRIIKHESNLVELFGIFNKNNYYYFILDNLSGTLWLVGFWLTIYYLTPFHFIISETITEFCETVLKIIEVKSNEDETDDKYYTNEQIITFFILYIFIFFGVAVFNEIIIIGCCNLNKNTHEEIDRRQSLETIKNKELNEENEENEENEDNEDNEDNGDDPIILGEDNDDSYAIN